MIRIPSSQSPVTVKPSSSVLATNRVLRNTYLLLSLTLLFSAATAFYAMTINAQPVNLLMFFIGVFGLSMLTQLLRNSVWGIVSVFAFTGFLGYVLGPILNIYLQAFINGAALIGAALGMTGIIFLVLSAYVLATRKDFSYLGGFLFAALLVAFLAGIASIVFQIPALSIIISGVFALLASAVILYQTSLIVHGGERNYILATISLYTSLFNLFLSLLRILSFFAGNRE